MSGAGTPDGSRIWIASLSSTEKESISSLKVTTTFVSWLTSTAPAAGENDVIVGGVVSGGEVTVTVISVGGICSIPPLSNARLLIVVDPKKMGVQLKLQALVPVARFQVTPPSSDTSTLTTDLPPAALAVPVMLTVVPIITVAPAVGDVIVEVGAKVSGVGVGVGVGFAGMLALLLTIPHPAPNRIELTTASHVRITKTLT